jgi:hypothetical protein
MAIFGEWCGAIVFNAEKAETERCGDFSYTV